MTAPFLQELAALHPGLDALEMEASAGAFEAVAIRGGETLVREGEPSDALFVLVSGRLTATRRGAKGKTVRAGEIGRGELVGEMSLFTGARRTATVTALRDSRLLRISHDGFFALMQRHNGITRAFVRVLVERATDRMTTRRERLSTLALTDAGTPGTAAALADALAPALAADAKVARLDWAAVQATFPGDAAGAGDDELARWLNDVEQLHDLVLMVCDGPGSRWTRLALRQADRVLAVTRASHSPNAATTPERDAAGLRDNELVLLHPRQAQAPSACGAWLDALDVNRHHHLREGDAGHAARLARHLLGRSVGLALGGGGARAFAQLGVLRALREAGIPVDTVAGTSMGAVIGALVARGLDDRAVLDAMRQMVAQRPFSGVTLPVTSLLSGTRLTRALDNVFGTQSIEDLWLPYACVACNLGRGGVEVPSRGPLALWLRASNAVPGIVPPVVIGGDLYVDGGLLDNVPVDVAAQRNSGPVIAVNVSGETAMRAALPDGPAPAGWRALGNHAAPGLATILMRSMLLASAGQAAATRSSASLYLTPPLPGADPAHWHALEALADAGYHHAISALNTWDPWNTTGTKDS